MASIHCFFEEQLAPRVLALEEVEGECALQNALLLLRTFSAAFFSLAHELDPQFGDAAQEAREGFFLLWLKLRVL